MNLLLVGGESAGLHTLKTIASTGHSIVGVLTSPSRNGFSGADVAGLAGRMGVPTWPASRVRDPDFHRVVRTLSVDILLNVHSLHVIDPGVLDAPRLGCFNLHPGPLPECAGLNAPSWAIHQGVRGHGSTLHWIAAGIDTGPVAFSARFPIEDTDTGLSLALKCIRAGVPLVEKLLHTAACDPGAIPRVEQTSGARRFFHRGPPNDGRVSWSAPAREVFDFARAADYRPFSSPWGHPRTTANGRELGIVSTRLTACPANEPPGTIGPVVEDGVKVACGDEWLVVREIHQSAKYQPAAHALASVARLS